MKKTILISGATSDLAGDVINRLKKKYNLVLLYRKQFKNLSEKNKNINHIKYDYSERSQKNLIRKLEKNKIIISSMLHFNGVHSFSTINSISTDEFRKVYEANCFTFIKLIKLIKLSSSFNSLKSVLTISSVSSMHGNKGITLYSSSKAALNNIVKSFALELSKKKIRVNSIILGHIQKGMGLKTTNFLNEHQIKFLEEKHPLGFGNAEDLFHSIDFLIDSKKSRWITGTNFILDGGYLI